jgi:hypothetical protein
MASSPFKPGTVIDPKAAYVTSPSPPPSQGMSIRDDKPISNSFSNIKDTTPAASPFKPSVSQPAVDAGFKAEAVQPKPVPQSPINQVKRPADMSIPGSEYTAAKYAVGSEPYVYEKRPDEIRAQGSNLPTSDVVKRPVPLAYEQPDYSPKGNLIENMMDTPKFIPEKYTSPDTSKDNPIIGGLKQFSAGQLDFFQAAPFFLVTAPAQVAFTITQPQKVVASIASNPAKTLGSLSAGFLIPSLKGVPRAAYSKVKASKVPVSFSVNAEKAFFYEGSGEVSSYSIGKAAIGKGEKVTRYDIASVSKAIVKKESPRQADVKALSDVAMVSEKGKMIRSVGVSQTKAIKLLPEERPSGVLESYRTYTKGKTAGFPKLKGSQDFQGRGGVNKISEVSDSRWENTLSISRFRSIEASATRKSGTISFSNVDVVKLKPPTKSSISPTVHAPPELPPMKPFTIQGPKTSMTPHIEEAGLPGLKSSRNAGISKGIKSAKEEYAGYEPPKLERPALTTSYREEAFVGSSPRAELFRESKMAQDRLAERGSKPGYLSGEPEDSQGLLGGKTTLNALTSRQGQDITPVTFQYTPQVSGQRQGVEQLQKLRQEPQQTLRTPARPISPPRIRPPAFAVPMPKFGRGVSIPTASFGGPSSSQRRFKMPRMKGMSLGFKEKQAGLPDVVLGAALRKGKPMASAGYGYLRRKRR